MFLQGGQRVVVKAVGQDYTTFQGFKDAATGETVIGLSYQHLCQDVQPGGRILLDSGMVCVNPK